MGKRKAKSSGKVSKYTAEGRRDKNKARRNSTHENHLLVKKTKAEARIKSVKTVSDYKAVRHICPKLCQDAHIETRKRLHIPLPVEYKD